MKKDILLLSLIVPAPTLGVLISMYWFPATEIAKYSFLITKVWPLLVASFFLKKYYKSEFKIPKFNLSGFKISIIVSCICLILSLLTYEKLFSLFVEKDHFLKMMGEIGLTNKYLFIGLSFYWCFINSLIEEYIWRFSINNACKNLWKKVPTALIMGSLFFTLHHTVSLNKYTSFLTIIVGSLICFIAGYFWSWLYEKYQNIWACYIGHIIADLCIFIPVYLIIFT